jgi:hypothetical protein
MDPDVSLCEHLRSPTLGELPIDPADVLDWSDGPVTAVARCRVCAGAGLLEMLDWSRSRRVRIFALSALPADAFVLYRRNVERGSCDATRARREAEALFSAAGPVERVVALDVDANLVVRAAARPADLRVPDGAWEERLPREDDGSWFERLGLEK